MNFAEVTGMLVIALCVMILVFFSFLNNVYISVRNFTLLFLILTSAIVVMVFNLDPSKSIRWDLLVHFQTLENMRTLGLDYVLHQSEYKNLFIINGYFYLIALIGENRLLPVFPVIIDFLCALYLIKDQLTLRYGDAAPIRDCAFITALWFMSFGFMLSVSGIRCVLAMAVGITGLYIEYYKKENRYLGYSFYVVAMMTHSLGIAIPLIRIFLFVRNKIVLLFVLITSCLFFSPVTNLLSKFIDNSYFRYLLNNLSKYWRSFGTLRWFRRVYNSDRTVFLCYILICLFNLFMLWKIWQRQGSELYNSDENNEKYRIWNLISTVAILYVTGLFNALFTQRVTYILAYSFPMSVPIYLASVRRSWKVTMLHLIMIAIFFWLFFFNDLYIFLVNFTGVYFLDL